MIEIIPAGNRWTWRMICHAGRVLAYTSETWPCDGSAFAAAKSYRAAFWRVAAETDHRMAACI